MKVTIKKTPRKAKNGASLEPLTSDLSLFHGPSHADGGIPYKGIEVEGGEPLYKAQDGSETVFGNMFIPGTGIKFKQAAKNLAKKEQKVDSLMDSGAELVNNYDWKDKWDELKFNAGKAMLTGGMMKKQELKQNKEHMASLQQALLESANEMGLDPFQLSRGKAVKAKNGAKIKAANGRTMDPGPGDGDKLKEKFDLLQQNVLTALKKKYPNSNFKVEMQGDDRSIEQQMGFKAQNKYSPSFGIHNLGGARDVLIYQDGKKLDKSSPVYKNVLHKEAKNVGLYPLSGKLENTDPWHISAVQEGQGHSFSDLVTNYPGIKDNPVFKKNYAALEGMVKSGKADSKQIEAYKQLSGSADNYNPFNINYNQYSGYAKPGADQSMWGEMFVNNDQPSPTLPDFKPGAKQAPYNPRTVNKGNYSLDIKNPKDLNVPSNAKGLDWYQIAPELAAYAQNKVQPVAMQQYNPQLLQPTSVSFQDRLNDNQSSFNALQRIMGNNPEALSTLAGQKYAADNSIRGDEFRTNQQIEQDITNKNITLLNDAQLKNLSLADTQYVRQEQAKSNTKALNNTILNSISGKIAENEARNQALRYYETMSQFRYNPDTKKIEWMGGNNADYLNIDGAHSGQNNVDNTTKQTYDASGNLKGTTVTTPGNLSLSIRAGQSQLMQDRLEENRLGVPSSRKRPIMRKNGGSVTKFFNDYK